MIIAAIDGACRRNGTPDCVSAGGVFMSFEDGTCSTVSTHEYNSTNQRGELHALLLAIVNISYFKQEAQILTDSEYIFNAMTKQWYTRWSHYGWRTANGDDVKNKDLWQRIYAAMLECPVEIHFYHIKGHCIPFGKVTATNLLHIDPSGRKLLDKVEEQFELVKNQKQKNFDAAQYLSYKNNGFELSADILKRFITFNTVADAVATKAVEIADRER